MGKIKTTAELALEAGTTLDMTSTNAALTIAAGTGTISIGDDVAVNTISIGSVAANKTINIGFGLANMAIRIGVANGTSSVAIESGTGGVSVNSVGGSAALTGSTGVNIDSAAGTIGVGTNNSDNPVNIGTLATAGRAITMGNATGTTAVTVNVGTGALNLGTAATVHTSTLGSVTGASATTLQSGTGALNVTSTNGALTINSGTGALSLSNDASATTLTIGTGAAAKTVTVGSTNTTSATTINSGTGALGIGTSIAKTITIGNTTGATAVNINIGTGDFTMTSATGTLISQLDTGEMTRPLQPAFLATIDSDDTNVTGDGTVYTLGTNVAFTEIFDQGNDFNTNGTFTAPITGRYQFFTNIRMSGLAAAMTRGEMKIATSNRSYFFIGNTGGTRTVSNDNTMFGSTMADMDVGDTCTITVSIQNGTLVADVDGTAAGNVTVSFSGCLLF